MCGGSQEGWEASLHTFHPACQQLALTFPKCQEVPHAQHVLMCSARGGLGLVVPPGALLKPPGSGTGNTGAVTSGPSQPSAHALPSLRRNARCQHRSWQLRVAQAEELQSHLWIMAVLPFSPLLRPWPVSPAGGQGC